MTRPITKTGHTHTGRLSFYSYRKLKFALKMKNQYNNGEQLSTKKTENPRGETKQYCTIKSIPVHPCTRLTSPYREVEFKH